MPQVGCHRASAEGKAKGGGKSIPPPLPERVLPVPAPDRGRILGEGGKIFKFICAETGVRLSLEASGESSSSAASMEAAGQLQVRIRGGRGADLNEAVKLVRDLLDSVAEEAQARSGARARRSGDTNSLSSTTASSGPPSTAAQRPRGDRGGKSSGKRNAGKGCNQQSREELRDLAAAKLAETEELRQATETLQLQMEGAPRDEVQDLREMAGQLSQRVLALEKEALSLGELSVSRAAGASSGDGRVGGFCALFPLGACPFGAGRCPRGAHGVPPVPAEDVVLVPTTQAKRGLLQQKWQDAGGHGQLVSAWQVRNPRLDLLLRATENDFAATLGVGSDIIDGWHGTLEQNVMSIAVNGFDPTRRCGQAYGAGEYFAKDPNVSVGYARGGAFMFLCKMVLGQADLDHTWVPGPDYYVLAQRENRVQAVPLFLLQFQEAPNSELARSLSALRAQEDEEPLALAARQPGALHPEEARRDAAMTADATRHVWVGWLSPTLRTQDDDAVSADVRQFLDGHDVQRVIPERNGARVGAFVLLRSPIDRAVFRQLQRRRYQGRYQISVDDNQPDNPRCRGKVCPRLRGPSRFCRGWNIRGHASWQWGCSFEHPENLRPTHGADFRLEGLTRGSAKFDEIESELLRSGHFESSHGSGAPHIVAVHRVDNPLLARAYEERRGFLHDKQGFAMEMELWHGTNCKSIPELLLHGLQPPSDTRAGDACSVSGGKGLCTTLCGTKCPHCTEPHVWHKCHMYGLGVYLADEAAKSHRYVRQPVEDESEGRKVYSLIRCRVVLGNPYLIEGNLLQPDAMHDMVWCQNPSEALETVAESWSIAKGHDAFYVRGQAGMQKAGLGVHNSEYVVFHPYQMLPLFRVDYVLR